MIKISFILMLIASSGSVFAAGQLLHPFGLNFSAPTVADKGNVQNPVTGELVYDYTGHTFWGYRDGALGWQQLGVSSGASGSSVTPNVQTFTSGSGTYYLTYVFSNSSANATAGATYTNNSQTCTVEATIVSSTSVRAYCTGDVLAGGTLSKSSGTGDATITYTSWAKPIYIDVIVVGGGAGGGGAASAAVNSAGGAGGGGGGFTRAHITAPGTSYSYAVAATANGGAAGNNAGTGGNSSSFGSLSATGGSGGSGSPGVNGARIDNGGAGGCGSGGDLNVCGSTGGYGMSLSSGLALGGCSGTSVFGGSVCVTANGNTAGSNGASYGAGGSGGVEVNNGGAKAGGNGAGGIVQVYEYYQ